MPVESTPDDEANPTEQTQQTSSQPEDGAPAPKKTRRWRWVLGAVAGLIVFIGLGALGGRQAGIAARLQQQRLQGAVEAVAQYQLGLVDLAEGRCDIARDRFEYVINLNPSYPEAGNRLAEAMMCATQPNQEAVAEATLDVTPTPDLRGADQLYADAQNMLANTMWTELLATLDTLRLNFPDYQPIQVDGMYYLALRNRGIVFIGEGNLEGGIYDLNRAEKIGPLDIEADNYRQWAIWYIIGQSFWEIDWVQSVTYFQLLANQVPNLHDANFFTVTSRLATAQVGAHNQLLEDALQIGGLGGWCEANNLLIEAEAYQPIQVTPEIQPTVDWIRFQCQENPGGQAATPTPRP
jgi:tetratricopeptide (TPR) repeat protein